MIYMNKGASTVLGVIIGLVIIGAAAYLFASSSQDDASPAAERLTKESWDGFSFSVPEGWSIASNTNGEIVLVSRNEGGITTGDRMTVKYIAGPRFESNDAKMGPFNIEKQEGGYITERASRDGGLSRATYDSQELRDFERIDGRIVFESPKRWATYVIAIQSGFIEMNIIGSGDTEALDELKNSITFATN